MILSYLLLRFFMGVALAIYGWSVSSVLVMRPSSVTAPLNIQLINSALELAFHVCPLVSSEYA